MDRKLDLSGWIVLSNMIGPGDEIIIHHDWAFESPYDRDVHAIVLGVSSNNLVAIDITTTDACYRNGSPCNLSPDGWLDLMHIISLVETPSRPTRTVVTLMRGDNKEWMQQGPFIVELERESNSHYFGLEVASEGIHHNHRVWPKKDWKDISREYYIVEG